MFYVYFVVEYISIVQNIVLRLYTTDETIAIDQYNY